MHILSNWNRIRDGRVNDGGRMRHDAAALRVPEAVHQSSDRPLHHRRRRESQESQRRPHHLAPARVAVGSTFNADRNADSNGHRWDNYRRATTENTILADYFDSCRRKEARI